MFALLKSSPARAVCLVVVFLLASAFAILGAAQQLPPREAPKANPGQGEVRAPEPADENFSILRVDPKAFAQPKPLVIQTDEQPDYTLEFLELEWRLGDPIHLVVIKPAGVKKPPAILYLHSFPSETDLLVNPNFCKFATKNGFAAVGFVSALTGHRYHSVPMREWFVSNLDQALGSSVHDVQLVLDYLSKRGDFDMDRVGMFGDGSGATIAILAAAVDSRIKVLDLLDPWGDWPSWMAKSTLIPENERPNFTKPDFLQKVAPLDPVQWLPQLNGRTVRLQEVLDVTVTPEVARKKIEAAMPPTADIVHYQDRKIFLNNVSQKGTALDWMKERLQKVQSQLAAGEDSQKRKTNKTNR
jgi:acetyl esterase/lipase